MKLTINSTDYINTPANVGDAGWDIIAQSEPKIIGARAYGPYWKNIEYIEYDTGLEIAPEEGYHTLVMPRSSISKTNLFLRNSVGLIDNGYRGTIKLRFGYIFQPNHLIIHQDQLICELDDSKIYKKRDRIGQLVFAKTIEPSDISAGTLEETQRGEGGFGSSGL
jgi:dUTP pyrophosphatase